MAVISSLVLQLRRAVRFDMTSMQKTEVSIEEMKGVNADIVGIRTTQCKTYHFLTDEYNVGTINGVGFVLNQNFIFYLNRKNKQS